MTISMNNLPAAEGGFEVTREMIEQWCAAYDAGELPDGYAFDGPIKPGRPKLANETTSSLSFKCPESGAEMIAKAAKIAGIKKSVLMRDAALERAAEILSAVS